MTRNRIVATIGSVLVAGSIALALLLHSVAGICVAIAGNAGPPPPCPQNNLIGWRIGIIIAGLVVAILLVAGDRIWQHRQTKGRQTPEIGGYDRTNHQPG